MGSSLYQYLPFRFVSDQGSKLKCVPMDRRFVRILLFYGTVFARAFIGIPGTVPLYGLISQRGKEKVTHR